MASKILANFIIMGSGIMARAFVQAYRQALANASRNGVAQEAMNTLRRGSKVMTEKEARQILGVTEQSSWEDILKRYDKLFERNTKNGTFYLQSKVHRAKECLQTARQTEAHGYLVLSRCISLFSRPAILFPNLSMASKILANLIIMGSGIVARAFVQAYRQALANASKNGVAQEALNNIRRGSKIMTEKEARQILGVTEQSSWEEIAKRYDKLFERNTKNGTFYLQSKIHRAKECLQTVRQTEANAAN